MNIVIYLCTISRDFCSWQIREVCGDGADAIVDEMLSVVQKHETEQKNKSKASPSNICCIVYYKSLNIFHLGSHTKDQYTSQATPQVSTIVFCNQKNI